MATNEVPRGPISGYVVDNVRRLRHERSWSLAELSTRLGAVGRPILASGIHRLEQGKRRIDVDDLVALAAALDVSPITLLLPFSADGESAVTDTMTVATSAAWEWLRGLRPLTSTSEDEADQQYEMVAFQRRSLPPAVRPAWSPAWTGREEVRRGEHREED